MFRAWNRSMMSAVIVLMMVAVAIAAPVTFMRLEYMANDGFPEEKLPEEPQTPVNVIGPEDEGELGWAFTLQDSGCGDANHFSNVDELVDYVNITTTGVRQTMLWAWDNGITIDSSWGMADLGVVGASPESLDYSGTNIQVSGVDEPDTVKTDGTYLYVKSGNEIVILKAYPGEEAVVLSKIRLAFATNEMFIGDSKLVLFQKAYAGNWWGTYVKVYDVSDPSMPELVQNISIDGQYMDSRLIGNYVYMVFNAHLWDYYYIPMDRIYLPLPNMPTIVNNGKTEEVAVPGLCYFDVAAQYYSLTIVASLNLSHRILNYKTFLTDYNSQMYVSRNNIYLAGPTYPSMDDIQLGMWRFWSEQTIIHKISIDEGDIDYVGNGTVSGYIDNQFNMDEYKGYFRAVTYEWSGGTNVYVMNPHMQTIGRLEGIATGESFHSARFMGTRLYLVTFKKIDPFFVIDLRSPTAPKVLGELKIPGYSEYLHPYDVNHIIGLGKDTYDMGNFAWYQGVKLSLFDVTDLTNPMEISTYVIGDRGTESAALYDHKAFMFSYEKNLLIIPIDLHIVDDPDAEPSKHGEFVWQGAYVFTVNLEVGFKLKGRITHWENDGKIQTCYHWYDWYYYQGDREKSSCIFRSLYIEDKVYTISETTVKVNQMDTLAEIKSVKL